MGQRGQLTKIHTAHERLDLKGAQQPFRGFVLGHWKFLVGHGLSYMSSQLLDSAVPWLCSRLYSQ
eukprot:5927491-Amphidinium_carterae.1